MTTETAVSKYLFWDNSQGSLLIPGIPGLCFISEEGERKHTCGCHSYANRSPSGKLCYSDKKTFG